VQRCLEVRFRELNLPTSPPEEVHVDLVRRAVVAGHGGSIGEYAATMSTGVMLDYAGGLAPWQLRYGGHRSDRSETSGSFEPKSGIFRTMDARP
jgi:hypothetical protein